MLPLIPLIAIIGSAFGGGVGVVKGGQGVFKNIKAKKINQEAQAIIEKAQESAVSAGNKSDSNICALGEKKLHVLDKSMKRFIDVFEKIHNIELTDSAGLKELGKYRIDKQTVYKLREMGVLAAETLGGLATGAGAGALTAFGAYGATMTFASASTGTAIATLSGVAAQNATLAFLGGGSLAAGGGGMALGTTVLGGLVAGPALLILGVVLDASARKNLEKALSNKSEAQLMAEELKVVETLCNGIAKRAEMFKDILVKLDDIFVTLISQLEYIVSTNGTDYSAYGEAEQNRVAMAMSMAGAVKKILDTPILNADGGLTDESAAVQDEMMKYHKNIRKTIYQSTMGTAKIANAIEDILRGASYRFKAPVEFYYGEIPDDILENLYSKIIYNGHPETNEVILGAAITLESGKIKEGVVLTAKGVYISRKAKTSLLIPYTDMDFVKTANATVGDLLTIYTESENIVFINNDGTLISKSYNLQQAFGHIFEKIASNLNPLYGAAQKKAI